MKPKIVVAGATGYIGRALVRDLAPDYDVLAVSRRGEALDGAKSASWDGIDTAGLQPLLMGSDAVVNLIGEPVNQRWTPAAKARIWDSRVDSTKAIASAIQAMDVPPRTWINGSATGYYGDTGDREIDERSPSGEGFLADLCRSWEGECVSAHLPATRRVLIRTGVVVGPGGGFLTPLIKLAKWFLGGPVGNGRQYVPWISLEDEVGLLRWSLENEVKGSINAVSPNQATQAELMKALRSALHRPWAPPAPAFAVKAVGAVFGLPAELALESCRGVPRVALDRGYSWQLADLSAAIQKAVK